MKKFLKIVLGILFSLILLAFLIAGIATIIESNLLSLVAFVIAVYISIKLGFKLSDKLIYRKDKELSKEVMDNEEGPDCNDNSQLTESDTESTSGYSVSISYSPTAIFKVAGVTKKNDEGKDIQKLISDYVKEWLTYNDAYEGLTNKDILEDYYGDKVYEVDIYDFGDIMFEPEPDNPYDENAIKVIHGELGHIGYVPRTDTSKVLDIIQNDYKVSGEILGGKYKYVDEYEDKVRVEKHNYGVKLIVSEE